MEKQRKWQFFLIVAVSLLTIYNILPTLFYYAKPLKDPVSPKAAKAIAAGAVKRVESLETETLDWIGSYCDLIQTKPKSISMDPQNRQIAIASFTKIDEAKRFRAYLPRAGSLIPFAPAQLSLPPQDESSKVVLIQRNIPIRLEVSDFSYVSKDDKKILYDRMEEIALALAGPSESSIALRSVEAGRAPFDAVETLVGQINALSDTFGDGEHPLFSRFAAHFSQGVFDNRIGAIDRLIETLDQYREAIQKEADRISKEEDGLQNRALLEKKAASFLVAKEFLKKRTSHFTSGKDPWTPQFVQELLTKSDKLHLLGLNPLFSELILDLQKERIVLKFHPDAIAYRKAGKNKERFEQLIIDELARIASLSSEELLPEEGAVSIPLYRLNSASGYLCLDQTKLAKRAVSQLQTFLKSAWSPGHPDLAHLQIVDSATYETLSLDEKALSLVVMAKEAGMNPSSLYVVAKGIDQIAKNYESFPNSELALAFHRDFRELTDILGQDGFVGYSGPAGDIHFEKRDFAAPILSATREEFTTLGTGKMALLELGNVEERLATENKIETKIHEDLLKWKDEYRAAQVNIDPRVRFDVPKPTKSIFFNNLLLSIRKIFRGDERKIIRWGLDLSGGKSIEVELIDVNHQPVKEASDLKQGVNELYNRFNKMGVSEVSIRQVGHHIVLDFPSSQAMSASELIKASTMYFHVVNEKFSLANETLRESVNRFLQEIWNEATVTKRKDLQSINQIARKHLHTEGGELRSSASQMLWDSGLRIAPAEDREASNSVDDSVSKIAMFRGESVSEWQNQSHPLLIVFRNWAIEGAHLNNIHSGYDPGKGNFLSFDVSSFFEAAGKKIYPQKDLFAWTSRYSKEKVLGTPLEHFSRGRGWRMAVILNDSVISAPTLDSGLKDSAMISGSFSQREVNKLASDLKVGSLTFTPQILSEKNVSPELGTGDRIKGITATVAALLLVILSMLAYYRFAGLIASIAVLFNLLILWATLQNLGATLSLAGLAAVVLTVGMAVDANVLVFERIKEEFAASGNIKSALAVGYKKAYSAIIDSNVTTIIAALILLNFDAGPIKSFAVNLIIGIASSMFTALFMTKFYFTSWAQNPKHTSLKMANWIRATRFNFLKHAKLSFAIASLVITVGLGLVVLNKHSIFGLDFTGGYALNLELKGKTAGIEDAFLSAGAAKSDFQIRELDASHVRVLFGKTLESVSKPFYQMPLQAQGKNPRIEWALGALQEKGIALTPESISGLESNWTSISGQMSESMRNNALIGLALSFLAIFIYLSFRFEYQFAAAALICLFHDVLITLGIVGLLHAFGVEIQIDLNTIAALMTIVGYSLNDTIIIFDRIREELQGARNQNLIQIVNSALNATLSRTTMTSGTTLLVLIALVLLGGPSIFGFSLVMTIGVFFGTLSSWFIAAPLMVFFQRREEGEGKTIPL